METAHRSFTHPPAPPVKGGELSLSIEPDT